MLTVDEAVQYFGIGEKKIRMLISEHLNSKCCFTVQVGCKSLINRKKFETFSGSDYVFVKIYEQFSTLKWKC